MIWRIIRSSPRDWRSSMRKLKLAAVLPIIQVVVASLLLLWADRAAIRPPNFSAAWLLCRSLNAPVMLLMILFGGNWNFVPQIPFVGRGLFLISVGFVWYLVGRALDRRGAKPAREPRVVTVLAAQSLVLVAGVLLLLIAWRDVSYPETSFRGAFLDVVRTVGATPVLGLIGTFLTLAWSVSLIFLSVRTFVRLIRLGVAESG
jgi:hypothetical protein